MKNNFIMRSLLILSVLVTGCSKLEIVYDLAPGFIAGKMDDYFDLDVKQEFQLKAAIRSELDRIVMSELPQYIELEKEWIRQLQKKDLTLAEVKKLNDSTRDWLFHVFATMEPALLPLALELSPKQLEYFHKKVLEDLAENEEKTSTPKGQKKELRRRFEFGLNWNFDGLSSSEEKLFESWLDVAGYPFKDEGISRKQSAQLFFDASKNPMTFKAHLEGIFRKPLALRTKEYAQKLDIVLNSYRDLQWKMLAQSTDKDRKRRVEHTEDHIEQLTKLREKILKSKAKK
ncbi:MAG: hypothetical protein KA715_13150 [Xanthomonadaceae bacterium]|nr:hypothetical protein [Xanthomonadaceae bacterium]